MPLAIGQGHVFPARLFTHLAPEWNGLGAYQVRGKSLIPTAMRFDGPKTYPADSFRVVQSYAPRQRITGTHWSGPRFFGLTPKRKA